MSIHIICFLAIVAVGFSEITTQVLTPKEIKDFRGEVLVAINDYRKKHGVPDLSLDDVLSESAQKRAEGLAGIASYVASPQEYGESMFVNTGNKFDAQIFTAYFYDYGMNNYDFDGNSGRESTADFTQMVWKSTTKVGVGIVKTTSWGGNKMFDLYHFFLYYSPKGNTDGKFAENVFKPQI